MLVNIQRCCTDVACHDIALVYRWCGKDRHGGDTATRGRLRLRSYSGAVGPTMEDPSRRFRLPKSRRSTKEEIAECVVKPHTSNHLLLAAELQVADPDEPEF